LLAALELSDGEPKDPRVLKCASKLGREAVEAGDHHSASRSSLVEESSCAPGRRAVGRWIAVTRPDFAGSIGRRGDNYCYTLGRMSFGLFAPNSLALAVKYCDIVVKPLAQRSRSGFMPAETFGKRSGGEVRTYDIEVGFDVVDPRGQGLSGTMVTYGFCCEAPPSASEESSLEQQQHAAPSSNASSPTSPTKNRRRFLRPPSQGGSPDDAIHRLEICFCGGELGPDENSKGERWADLFGDTDKDEPRPILTRFALWVAARTLGIHLDPPLAEGVQRYTVARPIKGFVDVLYSDDDLRVTRGNRGSLVVMRRAS
jgi:hypothetical protein